MDETWQMYSKETKRLNAFHLRCLRKILGITYKDRISNKKVLCTTSQRDLAMYIAERRMRWVGHLLRMDNNRFAKHMINWVPKDGKKQKGRPRLTWEDTVLYDLRSLNIGWKQAERIARERNSWKKWTALCVSRHRKN
jgi:hypothetical protein